MSRGARNVTVTRAQADGSLDWLGVDGHHGRNALAAELLPGQRSHEGFAVGRECAGRDQHPRHHGQRLEHGHNGTERVRDSQLAGRRTPLADH